MNDLTTLDDAFAELELRADSYVPDAQRTPGGHRPPGGPHRVLLAAASVVAVAGVATAAALLGGSDDTSGHGNTGNHPAGGPPPSSSAAPRTPSATATNPSTSEAPATPTRSPSSTGSVIGSSIAPPPPVSTNIPINRAVPQNAAQLAARLRQVLGDEATFTYTSPAGKGTPVIVGTLTRTSPHRAGGFDLQVDLGSPGDKAICEDPGESKCTVRRLPDHSSLSIGREHRGDTLYLVNLVRPNGVSLLMHVSNNSDPKGGGTVTSSKPPLTTSEMVQLLESPKWTE